jgi:hypothetical protein
LYKALKNSKVKKEKNQAGILLAIIPILVLLILGVISYWLYVKNNELSAEIDKINEYLNNPDISKKYEEVVEIKDKQKELNDKKDFLKKFRDNYNSYPLFNSELFKKIEACLKSDIVIHDISYSSSVGGASLVMQVSTTDIKAASTFTQDLSATQLFEKVSYDGWSQSRENEYTFKVTCLLKAGVHE